MPDLGLAIQGLIGISLAVIGLGMLDLKHKLSNLKKLDLVDGIVTRLESLMEDVQASVTDQAVLESRVRAEIDNLKERLSYLEHKVDQLHRRGEA
jgi:predicted  nucleic acid-binding Zn-ribbon protein